MEKKRHYLEYTAIQPQLFERYPLHWKDIFNREAALAVEIGFGNGDFLINWASHQPDWNFVGMELSMGSMEKLQKRIQQLSLNNICPIFEDARFALREFFPDNSVHQVVMNFPDPWPKNYHKNRRLLDSQFIETLAAIIKEDGYYELVSDQKWYAENAQKLFAQSPYFEAGEIEENPLRKVTTRYEKKWREMGRNSYRVCARKIKTATINRMLKDNTMPHVFIKKEIKIKDISALAGFQYADHDKLFVVKNAYSGLNHNEYLLEVVAKDDTYKQHIFILIYRHEENQWLVKLDPAVQPYRTPAVKMAVWKIGEILNSESKTGSLFPVQ